MAPRPVPKRQHHEDNPVQTWLYKNGPLLVILVILGAVAGLAYQRPPGSCPFLPGSPVESGSSADLPSGPGEGYPAYSAPAGEAEHPAPSETTVEPAPAPPPTFGTVEHATDAEFARLVLGSDGPVLVDFYADWCGPCRGLAPVVAEFARARPHVRVVKVDVDRSPRVANHYEIDSIPTLVVFRDGQVAARHVGLADFARLDALLAAD
jgi:thioredoxin 1